VLAKAHQADCGNALPTTYMGAAKDVYAEGALVFPAVRVQREYQHIDDMALFALAVGMVPVDPKPTRLVALTGPRERLSPPWRLLPIADKTHTRAGLFKPIPNPSLAKLIQARPSPAKLIQIKMLDFTWFYSSDSGLINGLQRIPNKNFLLAPRLVAKPRLARRASVLATATK
jgi:hypothetical protein